MVKILSKEEKEKIFSLSSKNDKYYTKISTTILETPRLYLLVFEMDKKKEQSFENSVKIMIKKSNSTSGLTFYSNEFTFKGGELCGYIDVDGSIEFSSISATIRMTYNQKKGIMTEALHNYYEYFFNKYPNYQIKHSIDPTNVQSLSFHNKFGSFKEKPNSHPKELAINKNLFFEKTAFDNRKIRIQEYYKKDQEYLKNTAPSENIGCVKITEGSLQISS